MNNYYKTKILVFAGSARKDSCNKKLAMLATHIGRQTGAHFTFVDLKQYPMPIYDGDLEEASGLPEHAKLLKDLFKSHHGLIICSPEYNSSFSPLLKNALDWVSRREEGENALAAYEGKIAAIMSASPGALGGLRGLVHLRSLLENIGVIVIPNQIAINNAYDAFNSDNTLKNEKQAQTVENIVKTLIDITGRVRVE